jgi:hypothetical protein
MPKFHIGSETRYLSADLNLSAMSTTTCHACFLFGRVGLAVEDGVFGVDGGAVEFGQAGLPEVERFDGVAGMLFAVGRRRSGGRR